MEDKRKVSRKVAKPTSIKTTDKEVKKTRTRKPSIPQKDMFTMEEKIAYCDKTYGKGNYRFMSKQEIKERWKLNQEIRAIAKDFGNDEDEEDTE